MMPDYKKMYLKMFSASENAINLLIAAQRECEEQYISCADSEVIEVLEGKKDTDKG